MTDTPTNFFVSTYDDPFDPNEEDAHDPSAFAYYDVFFDLGDERRQTVVLALNPDEAMAMVQKGEYTHSYFVESLLENDGCVDGHDGPAVVNTNGTTECTVCRFTTTSEEWIELYGEVK